MALDHLLSKEDSEAEWETKDVSKETEEKKKILNRLEGLSRSGERRGGVNISAGSELSREGF